MRFCRSSFAWSKYLHRVLYFGLVSVISLMAVATVINIPLAAEPALSMAGPGNKTGGQAELSESATFPFTPSSEVALLVNEVNQDDVYSYTAGLTGEAPIMVGGALVTLDTRNTYADPEIQQATQYVYEFMQAQELYVDYHEWSGEDEEEEEEVSGRNVIGVITGTVRPDEIVLVTAHIDDMPDSGRAPGADDNGSGSVAVMMAAARLSGHSFERTIRFIFFTGEEQGQLGSFAYATEAKANAENIVAVYNMDMIGWDANNDGVMALETRYITDTAYASDLAIANVFTQVVNTYDNLNQSLHPTIDPCNDDGVDSTMFWEAGFPSVTVIEDSGGYETNPNYHTVTDNLDSLNLPFFTRNVKASVGTIAHLAIPISSFNHQVYLPVILK